MDSAAGGTTNLGDYFSGNVNVTGTISKGGGSSKIERRTIANRLKIIRS